MFRRLRFSSFQTTEDRRGADWAGELRRALSVLRSLTGLVAQLVRARA